MIQSQIVEFAISNSTKIAQDLGLPSNTTIYKNPNYCLRCRVNNGTNSGNFGEGTQAKNNKNALGKGDQIFLILEHSANYTSSVERDAEEVPKQFSDLYTSHHYVSVDTFTIIRTVAQKPYGNITAALYKGGSKYISSSINFFSSQDNLAPFNVQSSRTLVIKFRKGEFRDMYWQKPAIKCTVPLYGTCVGEYKAVKCPIDEAIDDNSDPNANTVHCPIAINVVFEGTDKSGLLMESVGNTY